MPFVERAQQFIVDQGDLKNDKYCNEMVSTIEYMLKNAVGVGNAISTDKIIEYLRDDCGYVIHREGWQINVLGPLRDAGIYIGSHKTKGMFLISDINDAKIVRESIVRRLNKEKDRLEVLERACYDVGWNIDTSHTQ